MRARSHQPLRQFSTFKFSIGKIFILSFCVEGAHEIRQILGVNHIFPHVAVTPKTMVYILATCKIVPIKHTLIEWSLRLPSDNQGAEDLVFHRMNANQAHVKHFTAS